MWTISLSGVVSIMTTVLPEEYRCHLLPSFYPSLAKAGIGFDRFAQAHDSYEIWAKTCGVGRRMKVFAFPELVEDGGK